MKSIDIQRWFFFQKSSKILVPMLLGISVWITSSLGYSGVLPPVPAAVKYSYENGSVVARVTQPLNRGFGYSEKGGVLSIALERSFSGDPAWRIISRYKTKGLPSSPSDLVEVIELTDPTPPEGTLVKYRIRVIASTNPASKVSGNSFSKIYSILVPKNSSGTPTKHSHLSVKSDSKGFEVSWVDNSAQELEYVVYRRGPSRRDAEEERAMKLVRGPEPYVEIARLRAKDRKINTGLIRYFDHSLDLYKWQYYSYRIDLIEGNSLHQLFSDPLLTRVLNDGAFPSGKLSEAPIIEVAKSLMPNPETESDYQNFKNQLPPVGILLDWRPLNETNIKGIEIYKSESFYGPYSLVSRASNLVSFGYISLDDIPDLFGKTFYFKIRTANYNPYRPPPEGEYLNQGRGQYFYNTSPYSNIVAVKVEKNLGFVSPPLIENFKFNGPTTNGATLLTWQIQARDPLRPGDSWPYMHFLIEDSEHKGGPYVFYKSTAQSPSWFHHFYYGGTLWNHWNIPMSTWHHPNSSVFNYESRGYCNKQRRYYRIRAMNWSGYSNYTYTECPEVE